MSSDPCLNYWFNTCSYSVPALSFFIVGGALWFVAYVAVLYHVWKHQFVTIPAVAVVANISWEWLWGFFYVPDLGRLVIWGYRAWAILDVFIVFFLFKSPSDSREQDGWLQALQRAQDKPQSLIRRYKMTKQELVEHVHEKSGTGQSRRATAEAVDAIFDAVTKSILRDGKFHMPSFGTFTVKDRAARTGRNPQTGKPMQIAASKACTLKAAAALKASLKV